MIPEAFFLLGGAWDMVMRLNEARAETQTEKRDMAIKCQGEDGRGLSQ